MDVILLTSYVLITKLSFVCKRVYTQRSGSDHTIVTVGRGRLRHEIRNAWRSRGYKAGRQLTYSVEVLYVHATIKLKVVQRVSRGTVEVGRDKGTMRFLNFFSQLLPVITGSDSFVCLCLPLWLSTDAHSHLLTESGSPPTAHSRRCWNLIAMVQQDTAKKKKGPPKFQHLPKERGTPRVPLTRGP